LAEIGDCSLCAFVQFSVGGPDRRVIVSGIIRFESRALFPPPIMRSNLPFESSRSSSATGEVASATVPAAGAVAGAEPLAGVCVSLTFSGTCASADNPTLRAERDTASRAAAAPSASLRFRPQIVTCVKLQIGLPRRGIARQ
jgi:hypothetical protein